MTRSTRRALIGLAVLAALALAGAFAYRWALHRLQTAIDSALGPRGSVASMEVTWGSLRLHDVHVRGDPASGWPSPDELRAEDVLVVPDLRSFVGRGGWRIHSVTVHTAYIAALRGRDGHLHVLPSLIHPPDAASAAAGSTSRAVTIDQLHLDDIAVDFYDASVRQTPHRLRFEQVKADVGPIALPHLDQPMRIALQAVFKGPQHDGRLALDGQVTPATRDADLRAQLHGVDVVALQPYLLKVNEGGVRAGSLDLQLNATVVKNQLNAPGTLTLTGLQLGDQGGLLGTFIGVPRQAVLASMTHEGRIVLQFNLQGRLDDPKFSLNESLTTRLAGGLANALGVTLGGVVEGVGNAINDLIKR